MNTGNELVAKYYINHREFNIYGCWDKETPENEFDFYDIDEITIGKKSNCKISSCINAGCPFDTLPTRAEVKEFLEENNLAGA